MAGTLLILVIAAAVAVQSPRVQKRLLDRAIGIVERNTDMKLDFESVSFSPFSGLSLGNVVVTDNQPYADIDTILRAGGIAVSFSPKELISKSAPSRIRRISIHDASLALAMEPGKYGSNIGRVLRLESDNNNSAFSYDIHIGKIKGKNIRARFKNYTNSKPYYTGHGINWDDFEVNGDISLSEINASDGLVNARLTNAKLHERCGLDILHASTDINVEPGLVTFTDIHVIDNWSDINAYHYSMSYAPGSNAFSDYCNKVIMDAAIYNSKVSMQTVAAYGGVFADNTLTYDIATAHMHGSVNGGLDFTGIDARELGTGATIAGDASFTELEHTALSTMDLKLDVLCFTSQALTEIVNSYAEADVLDFSSYAKGIPFLFSGKIAGSFNDIRVQGDLSSGAGSAKADLLVNNAVDSTAVLGVSGSVSTDNLDLGVISGIKEIGLCTMRTGFKAEFPENSPSVVIDSLFIDRFGALGYDYSNFAAVGAFSGVAFDGKIICNDPNLNFLFQGLFNLSSKTSNALYKFYANLGYADLEALHIDTRGGKSKVSGQVSANFLRIKQGDDIGDISIRGMRMENRMGVNDIGDISIASHSNNNLHRVQIRSSFLDAGYVGQKNLTSMLDDIQDITVRRFLPSLYDHQEHHNHKCGECSVTCDLHDSRALLSFILPGLYIADSTSVRMNMGKDGILSGKLRSPRLAYGANYLKDVNINFGNGSDSLKCKAHSNEMRVGGIVFRNSSISAGASSDNFGMRLSYDNMAGKDNVGDIRLDGSIMRTWDNKLMLRARTLPSYVQFDRKKWNLNESYISYSDAQLSVDDLVVACGEQSISLTGGMSADTRDTLTLGFNQVDMDIVNYFVSQELGLQGRASGKVLVTSPSRGGMGVLANIACDSLSFGGVNAGATRIAGSWDEETNKVNVILRNTYDGREAAFARMAYNVPERSIEADALLKSFNLAIISPLLKEYASDMGGNVSGSFKAEGSIDHPVISSEGGQFEEAYLRVAATNVPYWINGQFRVESDAIHLDDIGIHDRSDGYATVNGELGFSSFRDLDMNMGAILHNLEVLNMPESMSEGFYGNLAASGDIKLSGPLDALSVDVNAMTSQEGRINVSMGAASASAGNDILKFKEKEVIRKIDPYEAMLNTLNTREEKESDIKVKARLNIAPEVEAVIEVDKQTGNALSVRGDGLVDLELRPAKDIFNVTGDYTISSGQYHFATIGSLVTKDFTIQNGSSIKLNGDPMDSELDVTAIYSLKAAIAPLLADTTSVATRRPVECSMHITDKISNMKVKFGIDIPDLDPTTKSMVESALNTDDKIQRQFISLLVTGAFLQDEQNGVINLTNTQYYNVVGGLMASQLNSILQKFDIPLDLDLNYQPGTTGNGLIDVGVSTQLFDNRVIASGNIGNRDLKTSNSTSEVVGNLDIEIKIDKSGQLRLTLFSHSADDYTNYLDNTQRNGVGIAYQKEFSDLGDYIRSLFMSRSERDQARIDQDNRDREKVTFEVK